MSQIAETFQVKFQNKYRFKNMFWWLCKMLNFKSSNPYIFAIWLGYIVNIVRTLYDTVIEIACYVQKIVATNTYCTVLYCTVPYCTVLYCLGWYIYDGGHWAPGPTRETSFPCRTLHRYAFQILRCTLVFMN